MIRAFTKAVAASAIISGCTVSSMQQAGSTRPGEDCSRSDVVINLDASNSKHISGRGSNIAITSPGVVHLIPDPATGMLSNGEVFSSLKPAFGKAGNGSVKFHLDSAAVDVYDQTVSLRIELGDLKGSSLPDLDFVFNNGEVEAVIAPSGLDEDGHAVYHIDVSNIAGLDYITDFGIKPSSSSYGIAKITGKGHNFSCRGDSEPSNSQEQQVGTKTPSLASSALPYVRSYG